MNNELYSSDFDKILLSTGESAQNAHFLHLKSIITSSLLKFLDKPISVDSYFNVVQKLGLVESAHFAY
jgi:hypothetical protein